MGDNVQINMMGRFEIIVNDVRIDQQLSKAKKGWTLIKYLLVRIGEAVPYYELYDLLWPNEESANPENALKTLVSRMRAFLNKCSPGLGESIVTNHGAYYWRKNSGCKVDMVEFEQLCREVMRFETLTDESKAMFERILSLYNGDLLPMNAQEGWAIARSVAMHNMYTKTVYKYLDLLKISRAPQDEIIRVCRCALEKEAFDTRFHLDLMDALVKTKRNNEAMMQYKHANNLHLRYLGVQLPDGIQQFYKQIIQAGQTLDMDIETIRNDLVEYSTSSEPFVCDYTVFKEIYNLQMRNLERVGTSIFIALIMVMNVDGKAMDPLMLDEVSSNMLEALVKTLRKGDTITHYRASQYALLLPSVNYETGKMVMERIKRAFYSMHPNSNFVCNYRLGPISDKGLPDWMNRDGGEAKGTGGRV